MERTPLREAYFAEVARDPYAATVARMADQSWVAGYEQALRDLEAAGVIERHHRDAKSYSERMVDAVEWRTREAHKAEAEAVMALAALGRDRAG